MRHVAVWLIRRYQAYLSPVLPARCRFVPSCSEYGAQAITHYGLLRGGLLTAWRLLRCNPFHPGGFDSPIPAGGPEEAGLEAKAGRQPPERGRPAYL